MRAADLAISCYNGGNDDLLRLQQVQQITNGSDIRYRVQRADLMEMHLIHGNAMDTGFRTRQDAVDLLCVAYGILRKVQFSQQLPDFPRSAMAVAVVFLIFVLVRMIVVVVITMVVVMVMVVVMMMVVMAVLFFSVNGHAEVRAGHALFYRGFGADIQPWYPQSIELLQYGFPLRDQFKQRCGEHIPRSAHIAFDIQGLHAFPPM